MVERKRGKNTPKKTNLIGHLKKGRCIYTKKTAKAKKVVEFRGFFRRPEILKRGTK